MELAKKPIMKMMEQNGMLVTVKDKLSEYWIMRKNKFFNCRFPNGVRYSKICHELARLKNFAAYVFVNGEAVVRVNEKEVKVFVRRDDE